MLENLFQYEKKRRAVHLDPERGGRIEESEDLGGDDERNGWSVELPFDALKTKDGNSHSIE